MNTRLKELRKERNISQQFIGEAIGVSQRGYSHYENDRDLPSDILIALADFYNTSVDYILYLTDYIEPYPRIKVKLIKDKDKQINLSIANRLKDLREDKDLYQKDIAEALGIARSTYSYYENGGDISTEILVKLAVYHNTNIDYILGITNEIKPYPKTKR